VYSRIIVLPKEVLDILRNREHKKDQGSILESRRGG
jgi:hypothetical protein